MHEPDAGFARAPGASVLLVEDEIKLRRMLRSALERDGHCVDETRSLEAARRAITRQRPDLIVLGLGASERGALDLVRRVQEASRTAVIVLSPRDDDDDKIVALDAGVDDYVTKPFSVGELLARVRAVLRRVRGQAVVPAIADEILEAGAIRIDVARREVTADGRRVHLTPIELHLLLILVRERGRVVTVQRLIDELWPHQEHEAYHLRVHMSGLRRKIERDPAEPRRILTMVGVGYRVPEAR